jgi:hypothetical protein
MKAAEHWTGNTKLYSDTEGEKIRNHGSKLTKYIQKVDCQFVKSLTRHKALTQSQDTAIRILFSLLVKMRDTNFLSGCN